MKNIFVYYLAITVPFALIIWWLRAAGEGEGIWPVLAFAAYCMIYRPIIDGVRLMRKGVMSMKQFKRSFIPFTCPIDFDVWFKELYLKP